MAGRNDDEMRPVKRTPPNTWRRMFTALTLVLSVCLNLGLTNTPAHANLACTYPNFDGCDWKNITIGDKNLDGASFIGANLRGADFANFHLVNTRFDGAELTGAKFTETTASGSSFIGANLAGADFTRTSLDDSNFRDANLVDSVFVEANLTRANFESAKLENNYIDGSLLSDVKMGQAQIKGLSGFRNFFLAPPSLPAGWLLKAGCFVGPGAKVPISCNFSKENLTGLRSGGVQWDVNNSPSVLPKKWALVDGYLLGPGADLTDADLSSIDLRGFSSGPYTGEPILPKAWRKVSDYLIGPGVSVNGDLRGAVLDSMNLTHTTFWELNLSGGSLRNANLRDANLGRVDFTGANFEGAWLNHASMWKANLDGADLSGASLQHLNACGITGTPLLPNGWSLAGSNIVGPKAKLQSSCDFTNVDFGDANLNQATLDFANIEGADLSMASLSGIKSQMLKGKPKALPSGWAVISGYLMGPEADLTDVVVDGDLAGVDLSGATLKNALIRDTSGQVLLPKGWALFANRAVGPGASLQNANLEGADLSEMDLSGVSGRLWKSKNIKLPKGWVLNNNSLIGPRANLTGARLQSVDLSGTSLEGVRGRLAGWDRAILPAGWVIRGNYILGKSVDLSYVSADGLNLEGLDLSSANFYRAHLTNVKGSPKLPNAFKLVDGVLMGPGVDLSGIDWTESNFGKVNLDGAILTGFAMVKTQAAEASFFNAVSEDKDLILPEGWLLEHDGIVRRVQAVTTIPTLNGSPKVGKSLSAVTGTWGPSVTLTYSWLREGVPIDGQSSLTYVQLAEDVGKDISLVVTGTKTGYVTVKKTSAAVKIEAGTLTLTPVPAVSGTFKVGQTLTATPGTWDTGVSLTYQWLRDGAAINGATSTSLTLTGSDFGKNISFTVNGTKTGYVAGSKESSKATVSAGSLTSTTPKITGTAKTGSVLKATTSAWTKGAKITYQWLANGVAIKGATSSSLKLATSHKGKKISVKVTQSALGYSTASKTSASVTVK